MKAREGKERRNRLKDVDGKGPRKTTIRKRDRRRYQSSGRLRKVAQGRT
jgi:hypothetical protein